MTRQQLSQVYFMTRELKTWEEKLDELIRESQIKGQTLDGMPFQNTGETSDKVARKAMEIVEYTEHVKQIRDDIKKKIREVDEYIASLDDYFLRQIIQYRCCKLMSWDKVAMMIGAGTSADSCRMYFNRKIPRR